MATSVWIPKIHAAGDSIVHGFGASIAGGWRGKVLDLAVAAGSRFHYVGDQTLDGLVTLVTASPFHDGVNGVTVAGTQGKAPNAGKFSADIALIQCGTNDAGAHTAAATILASMATMLGQWNYYLAKPWRRIILMNLLGRTDDAAADTIIQQVNAGIAAMVAGLSFASIITVFDQHSLTVPLGDGLHPNDAGYNIIGTALAPTVISVVNSVIAAHG